MSQAVSFTAFCRRYELDEHSEQARVEYLAYLEGLQAMNGIWAAFETERSIQKLKGSTH